MAARTERVAWVVPGRSQAAQTAPHPGHLVDRLRHVLSQKPVIIALSILCVLVLLITALPGPDSWKGDGGSGIRAASTPLPTPPEYPYLFPVTQYPIPTNLTNWGTPTQVRLTSTTTGTDYLAFVNNSSKSVWVASGAVDASDARALFQNKACLTGSGPTCVPTRSVYLTWSQPNKAFQVTTGTIGAIGISSTGSILLVAATVGSTITILSSTNGGTAWTSLGNTTGAFYGMVANSEQVLVASLSSGSLAVSTFSLSGGLVSDLALGTSGSYQNVTMDWTSTSYGQEAVVVASSISSGTVSTFTSTNGGVSFSGPQVIAHLNQTSPSNAFSTLGGTMLVPPGGYPGEVAMAPTGSGLFVLYTTRIAGRVQGATVVSPDGGQHWQGPYPVLTPQGSIMGPSAKISPTGDVEVTWRENANSNWEVDLATFSPNGQLIGGPTPLPSPTGGIGTAVMRSKPVVAVDWLSRPIVAWAETTASGVPAIAYTGEFPNASSSANYLQYLVNDPLLGGDFPHNGGGSGSQQLTSFLTNANDWIGNVTRPIRTLSLSAAQNNTTTGLSPVVTRFGINITTAGVHAVPSSTSLIAPLTGTDSANYYLATFDELLLNAEGVGVATSPFAWGGVGSAASPGIATPVFQASATGGRFGGTAVATITVVVQSPTSALLQFSGVSFPSYTSDRGNRCPLGGSIYYDNSSVPYSYAAKVKLLAGNDPSWTLSSIPTELYITGLTPDSNYTWDAWINATYQQTFSWDYCGTYGSRIISPPTISPQSIGLNVATGWASTGLTILPKQPYMLIANYPAKVHTVNLTAEWNNTILAQSSIWINETSGSSKGYFRDYGFNITDVDSGGTLRPLPVNQTYNSVVTSTSAPGGRNSSQTPSLALGSPQAYPAEQSSLSCSFNLTQPVVAVSESAPTNATANGTNTEQLEWTGNVSGIGVVTYWEYGVGENRTITNIPANYVARGDYSYIAVLHGLDTFAIYHATVGVGLGSGCLDKIETLSYNFQTPHVLSLSEIDQPYDSITKEGGGAQIWWELPYNFIQRSTFWSGILTWQNSGSTYVVPITNADEITSWSPVWYYLTLSLPQIDSAYSVNVSLVYKQGSSSLTITSQVLEFTYLKESTSDGLTDQEKSNGWIVDALGAPGSYTWGAGTSWVTANPGLYATNSLVSDYVEKWFGLDPHTLDTAGSHMLDTWNLTFDIQGHGVGTRELRDFKFWYENSTYNFSKSRPSPTVNFSSFAPLDKGATNLSDNGVWAAEVLWGYGALGSLESYIENESVVWLRAVEGSYDGLATITVWGKLSWGANPLTSSTPGDGSADGARVNPLYDVGLQLNFTQTSHGTGFFGLAACGNISNGMGVALSLSVPGAVGGPLQSYSGQFNASMCPGSSARPYTITIPVSSTQQWQSVALKLVANETKTQGKAETVLLPINGCALSFSFSVGMMNGTPLSTSGRGPEFQLYGNPNGTCSGVNGVETDAFFGATEVPYGDKAPTWLWVPSDNRTLGNLPPGLQRYGAEQDFALLVLRDTSGLTNTLTSEKIPFPWSTPIWNPTTGYTVSINPEQSGSANILVPRSQFFNSTLGRSVLTGTAYPQFSSTPTPLLGTNENSSIANFGMSNPLGRLSCYWQNRALYSGATNTLGCSSFTGTANGTADAISVMEDTNSSTSANGGGVPGNPFLENASAAGASLQIVVQVGVSSVTELDLLLASLLDNSSGGINGTLLSETNQVSSLGFSSAVVGGLVNQTFPGGGLWGVPSSQPVGQTSGCGSIWNFLSNSPGGDLSCIVSGVTHWVGVLWTLGTAAVDYLSNPSKLFTLGLQLDQRVESAVSAGGRLLDAAIQGLINWAIKQSSLLLSAALNPLAAPAAQTGTGVQTDLQQATSDVNNGNPNAAKSLEPDLNAQIVHSLLALMLVAGVTCVVVTVLSALSGDVAPMIIGIFIGLIIGLTFAAIVVGSHSTVSLGTLVWWADNFQNCTSTRTAGFSCSPGDSRQKANQPAWNAAHVLLSDPNAVGWIWSILSVLAGAAGGYFALTVSFGLMLLGMYLTLWGANNPSQRSDTDIFTGVVDFISLVFDARASTDPDTMAIPGAPIILGITMGVDVGVLVTDAYL